VCMRVRHFPFTIDERSRDVWLGELLHALIEVEFPSSLLEAYWEWVEPMSIRMINRRTSKAQPLRYPFTQVKPFLVSAGNQANPIIG
jgi:hemoglobin